jgi:hypothetical protein
MWPRLASGLLVSALIRQTQAEGGFATVLAKGDATAGAILLVALEKGRVSGLWERIIALSGDYQWTRIGPQDIDNERESDDYISRRRVNDPDLWVIELDIPDAAQFAARFTAER